MGSPKPRVAGFQPNYDNVVRSPPPAPKKVRRGNCKGNDDTCGSFAAKGTEFCVGHMRSLGLLDQVDKVEADE